jgi:diphthine-ammonia ligase
MNNSVNNNNYVVSWSGGKDGCMACYHALEKGCNITRLVNFISDKPNKVRFHGTNAKLMQIQAQAMGIELLQPVVSWEAYERDFKQTISGLKPQGVTGMVFGDIYVQEHLDWVQRVCSEIGVEALEPLWGRDTGELLNEFIDAGFEAVIVCAKSGLLDREWIGRRVDRSFMDYLGANGIDYCGEKGEYHTLVTGGPLFKHRIKLLQSETVDRDGHWLLEISKYELV